MNQSHQDFADLADATWAFVRERFAFQCKQLRKLTGLSAAKSYDLLARCHGFSGWRGMSKVLQTMQHVDRHRDDNLNEEVSESALLQSHCVLTALCDLGEHFPWRNNGEFLGTHVEAALCRLPVTPGPEEVYYVEGVDVFTNIREHFMYMSLWLGESGTWSAQAFDAIDLFVDNLSRLWTDDDDQLNQAMAMIFGNTGERFGAPQFAEHNLRRFDAEVRKCLSALPSRLSPDLQEAYRLSALAFGDSTAPLQSVSVWRHLLRDAHPASLDARCESGPIPVLLLANASDDCVVSFALTEDSEFGNGDVPARCFYGGQRCMHHRWLLPHD